MRAAPKKTRGGGASRAAGAAADDDQDADEAGPSRADGDAVLDGDDDDDDDDGDADDGEGDSSDGDDHAYVSDSDSDADGGMVKMLHLLEQDKNVEPEELLVSGKRQRKTVDYCKLNDEMFGNAESYEGEGVDDDEFKVRASGTRRPRKRKS